MIQTLAVNKDISEEYAKPRGASTARADAILHLPGGQSGHPLSPHYRDQYRDWLEGRALPLAGQPVNGVLILKPATGG